MAEKSFHHDKAPCPKDPCCKNIHITCECKDDSQTDWLKILMLFLLTSAVIIICTIWGFWHFWYKTYKSDLPDDVKDAIAWCADQGSLHPSLRAGPNTDQWLRGQPPNAHPDGTCKNIKKIIHQSIHYCKNCEEIIERRTGKHPLARGQGVEMQLSQNLACAGDPTDLTIRVLSIPDNSPKQVPPPVRVYTNNDLDIPTFCNNSGGGIWSLLDTPRVNYTRTTALQQNNTGEVEDVSTPGTSAPYVVFVARQNRSDKNINVFFVYVDAVTYQPAMIEIALEVLDGAANFVDSDGRLQLLSNIRLNSIEKTITFNIGQGARRLSVAGMDFGPVASTSTPRSQHDTSGSYIVDLSDTGAVEDVRRR